MPTYLYRCKSCQHEFEEFQRMSDDALKICPACTKHTLVRLFAGGTSLVFKGSGFYITDYKGKSSSSSNKKEPGSESKQETKPAESTKPSGDSAKKE